MLLRRVVVLSALAVFPSTACSARSAPNGLAAESYPSVTDTGSWIIEPRWMESTAVNFGAPPEEEVRPEPIPLPPAGVIGPAVLTGLVAALSLKNRRTRARVLR
ncbi:MAG: hypothetical protein RMJ35_09725 [Phycisphaerales bacterium]|nr:hypothetical protein [Phycisphaerales bacterium]